MSAIKDAPLPGANVPIWGAYLRALQRRPLNTKIITSGVLFVLSQIMGQLISMGEVSQPWKVFVFGLWGFLLPVGAHPWQNFMQSHGPAHFMGKIPVDHFFWRVPILILFSFYNKMMDGARIPEAIAYTKKTNLPIQIAALKLWPVCNAINFALIPLPLRVLWQNFVLSFWTIYLALQMRERKPIKAA
mmetsp:Transcript_21137/g.46593  ORF Transcript_21137/g.46593 Transcript_21137/m.46593 type:complete len:188 (-) Transcript_21137:113-676(-)